MRIAIALAFIAAALPGAALARVDTGVDVPASAEPAPIHGGDVLGEHVVEFGVNASSCSARGLKLDHVRLVERPKAKTGLKAAIVTVYLFRPAHVEGQPCLRIRARRRVRIRTKRPAADLVFFDGSSVPPRRVFPLPEARAGA